MLTQQEMIDYSKDIQAMNKLEGKSCLTAEEENIVSIGKEAVDIMVEENLGLVYFKARSFGSVYGQLEFEDLVQEGMIGLYTAVTKFDGTITPVFSSFAIIWIQQAMSRGVNKYSRLVRVPENRIIEYSKYRTLEGEIINAGGEITEDIKEELGKEAFGNTYWHRTVERTMLPVLSFDTPLFKDSEDNGSWGENLMDFNEDFTDIVDKNLSSDILYEALNELHYIEGLVVRSFFEIGDFMEREDIERQYEFKKGRFKTILQRGLKKMRKFLENKDFDIDLYLV